MEIYGEYGPYVVWVQGEGKRSASAKSSYHNGIYASHPRVCLSFDEKPISKMVYPLSLSLCATQRYLGYTNCGLDTTLRDSHIEP